MTNYIENTLISSFDSPCLDTFYPDDTGNSSSDSQKKLQVQLFALSQAACLSQTFKPPALLPQHLMLAMNLLVRAAFLDNASASPEHTTELQATAQSKLFGLVGSLSKVKLTAEGRKGECKEGELWIARLNKLICKIIKAEEQGSGNEDEDAEEA